MAVVNADVFQLAVLIILVMLSLSQVGIAKRLQSVHRQLEALLRHSDIDFGGAARKDALALLKERRKLEAIKRYRDMTGCTLMEAKKAIEELESSELGDSS